MGESAANLTDADAEAPGTAAPTGKTATSQSGGAAAAGALSVQSTSGGTSGGGGLALPAYTLWRRELVRFFRQRNRVVSALATPMVFWVLLGSGLSGSFSLPTNGGAGAAGGALPGAAGTELSYLEYFFPGTVVLILLFTAIFATITVIEDRREGFLQGVLVSPAPRLSIALGKVLGGATIATIQGVLFLLLWPLVGPWPGVGHMLAALVIMFVLAVGLNGLGLCIAWPMDSTAAFHAIMNLFLMPMWFLSGAMFPVKSAPVWMRVVMYANPLTYGQALFSDALTGGRTGAASPAPVWVSITVTLAFTVGIVMLGARMVSRPRKDGLP
jgi:ABC-2 type transport system permease protein